MFIKNLRCSGQKHCLDEVVWQILTDGALKIRSLPAGIKEDDFDFWCSIGHTKPKQHQ